MEADTTGKFLRLNAEKWGDKIAIREKDYGIWRCYTWKQTYEIVKYICLGLISLGLEQNERVALLGDSEPELYWAFYAIQSRGAWIVGIYPDCIPQEITYFVQHSESKFIFARDQEQVDKLLLIRKDIPFVEKVIWWEPKGMRKYTDPWLLSFVDLVELGRKYEQDHPRAFEDTIDRGEGSDVMGLFYTSGTTGLPKGAIVTYDSWNATLEFVHGNQGLGPNHNILSIYPPAWFAEPVWSSGPSLRYGVTINCPEEPDTFLEDFREISPSIAIFGARQYENIASTVQVKINDSSFLKRFIFNLFLPIGYRIANMEFEQKRPNLLLKVLHFIARRIVFLPLLDKHGLAKGKYFGAGGSAIGQDTFLFLRAIGVPIIQTYGSTEAGVFCKHTLDSIRKDTVGRICPGVEARIDDKGELLVRSAATSLGYYKNPAATSEKLEPSGWFHTGDALHMDEWGNLIFLDRLDEMEELSTGVRYAPSYIESQLRFCPYIKDVMTIGGRDREYVSALINIDFESVGKWAENHHIPYTTLVDLSQKTEVADLMLADILRVNKAVPQGAGIRKYVVMYKEFDPDEAELTRTRKLRRSVLTDRYNDLIEAIYGDKREHAVTTLVTYRDGRKGTVTADLKIRAVEEQ